MSLRDIRRKARGDLHNAMKVPALYLPTKDADGAAVGVRVHTKFNALGNEGAGGPGWAERVDTTPRIIFRRTEVQPVRLAYVSVEAGEVYQVGVVHPADGDFVTADVTILTAAQIGTTFPDGQPVPS